MADSSGNWRYITTLLDGDHQVGFTSNESTVSFTLTIGEDILEGIGALLEAETPTVGTVTPTVVILFSGILLISSPLVFKKRFL